MKRYVIGAVGGFLLGALFIHPFAMMFQDVIHPAMTLDFTKLLDAYNPNHGPMALFFGLLGMTAGIILILLVNALAREKERIKILEGLLPICSYCKQIRDDSGKEAGKGDWVKIEEYIAKKTDADFTHCCCPECFKKVMHELERIAQSETIR